MTQEDVGSAIDHPVSTGAPSMTTPVLSDRLQSPTRSSAWPGLYPGDHLDQPTFHQLYEAAPEGFKAELIEGVVMVPFAVSSNHGDEVGITSMWLNVYRAATPGTRVMSDATIILGPRSEPQPDTTLLILPEYGGQTRLEGEYTAGPPELVVEVAYSSHSYDLHSKYRDYERAGVREYIVLVLHQHRIEWFVARESRFEPLAAGDDGLFRSATFPGLWLDPTALLTRDVARVLQVLQLGLATPEHAAFVQELQARRAR